MAKRWSLSVYAVIVFLAASAIPASAETETQARIPLHAAIHVHSTASTGSLSVESLAERAERQGLDVLILSDNFTLRYDYGLRPFEGLIKYTVSIPSVLDYGIERFLSEVRDVQRRHPNLILVPGMEVAPHYYWTGSLWRGDLTMHNAQRNLLVIGLDKAEDYERLPARGNPQSFAWDERSLVNGAPLLILMPAWLLWVLHTRMPSGRLQPIHFVRPVVAATALLLCAGLAVTAWPLSSPLFGSYDAQAGYRPYQALIDDATARGGLVFWSMTEARDFSRHSFGPLGTVTVQTDPHPESLLLTQGYTGFGGLYQDTRRFVAPGGVWDQTLQAAVADRRQPPTMVGEVAFHGLQDAAKDLDRVYTVLQVKERTAAAAMEALRSGHAYAVARGEENILLQLDQFLVTDRTHSAGIGDRLESAAGDPFSVRVGVSAVDRKPHPARLRIIRSGRVIGQIEGQTPLQYEVADSDTPAGEWQTYRVEVIGRSGELLTNPVYVKRSTQAVSCQHKTVSKLMAES